jgi:hypothetical protein
VLSVLVVHHGGDLRPGAGFWGIQTEDGHEVTPAQADDAVWAEMCQAVYDYPWPPEFDDLPPA